MGGGSATAAVLAGAVAVAAVAADPRHSGRCQSPSRGAAVAGAAGAGAVAFVSGMMAEKAFALSSWTSGSSCGGR